MLEEVKKYLTVTEQDLQKEVILKKQDEIFYLLLNRKANLFNHEFIRDIQSKLDEVEESQGPACLVTISLDKKNFSGGLDLKYISSNFTHESEFKYFVIEFIALLGRILSLGIPTIAVVKGAAIAGGCMVSFAHDMIFVVDKATFACNEVDIGLPLPPGMMSTIKRKHSTHRSLRDMTLLGKKFSQKEALQEKMIDQICEGLKPILDTASRLATYGENRQNLKKIKAEMNKQAIDACYNKQLAVGTVVEARIKTFARPRL